MEDGARSIFLYAINPDQSLKWRFSTRGDIRSAPVIGTDGIIYFGSEDGSLYAVNPDGSLNWSLTTEGEVRSSPAIGANGVIYFASNLSNGRNKFYAIGQVFDLSVSLIDSPRPVLAGTAVRYELEIVNAGPQDATWVVLADTLPEGVSLASATPTQGSWGELGGILECQLGELVDGTTAGVNVQVTVDLSTVGSVTGTASIRGDGNNPGFPMQTHTRDMKGWAPALDMEHT